LQQANLQNAKQRQTDQQGTITSRDCTHLADRATCVNQSSLQPWDGGWSKDSPRFVQINTRTVNLKKIHADSIGLAQIQKDGILVSGWGLRQLSNISIKPPTCNETTVVHNVP
jgi:hypothetical protein